MGMAVVDIVIYMYWQCTLYLWNIAAGSLASQRVWQLKCHEVFRLRIANTKSGEAELGMTAARGARH